MLSIAWNNLTHERGRFAISVGGVAFAVVLILIVSGLYAGWNQLLTRYIESVRADFWVAQKGSGDISHSISLLKNDFEAPIAKAAGVKSVRKFIGRRVAFDLPKKKDVFLYIVGFDPAAGENGPIKMVRGSSSPKNREVIIDQSFAKKNKLDIDGTIPLKKGEDWKIVGVAEGGNQVVFTYAFVNQNQAESFLEMQNFVNYFLVSMEPGADPGLVQKNIEAAADVKAIPRADFIQENKKFVRDAFLPIISVLLVISFAIGAAVIGLTIYTATVEKAGEYGVLKALGFSRWDLYKVVLTQSLISGFLGYILGVALSFVLAWLVSAIEPSFITKFYFSTIFEILVMTVVMAVIAAWAPTHRITSIDPTEVFRA